jgi:exopolysaccharide biosynthesis protein
LHITQKISQIAQGDNALFAVNGDYYGYRDDGIIVRNGVLYRDKPARDMLAIFNNGSMSIIDEKNANIKSLMSSGLLDSFSFGPALIKNGKIVGNLLLVFRDSWFIQNLEPRTGIGFISPNHFVFIVVDGRKESYSRGMTLTEFAKEFSDRGCKEAYNLDGGGSSTMYFKGRVVNNPLGRNGNYERYVSDIIYIDKPK